jgi:hypothetical protein
MTIGKKHLCEQNSAQRTNDELLLKKTQQTQKNKLNKQNVQASFAARLASIAFDP